MRQRTPHDAMAGDPGKPVESGILAPLRAPGYPRLFAGNAVTWQFGWMEMIVTGWLVFELTGSPWKVALVDFYRFAPWLVVGFISGPIIDRFGRKNVILFAQWVYFLGYGSLATLVWSGHLVFWHIPFIVCFIGGTFALDFSARRSLLPDLVGRARTLDAVLLETLAQTLTFTAGPFVGGTLVEFLGARGCYTVVAVGPLVSFMLFVGLPNLPAHLSTVRSSAIRKAWEGIRYVRSNRTILGILLITIVMNVLVFPYLTLLPVFARGILHQGPMGLGLLGTASGIGAFIGLLLVNHLRDRTNNRWLFSVGSVVQSAFLVAFALSSSFSLSLGLLALSGIGQGCFVALQSSVVLLAASDEMRDRAMGALILAIGTGPLGRLLVGATASGFGAPRALGSACLLSALLILAITVVMPEYRRRRPLPT